MLSVQWELKLNLLGCFKLKVKGWKKLSNNQQNKYHLKKNVF